MIISSPFQVPVGIHDHPGFVSPPIDHVSEEQNQNTRKFLASESSR
jgi:hypothetical protein